MQSCGDGNSAGLSVGRGPSRILIPKELAKRYIDGHRSSKAHCHVLFRCITSLVPPIAKPSQSDLQW